MAEVNDIEAILTKSKFTKQDGSTKDYLHGYLLYKKSPIMALSGWRISPDKTYKFTRYSLSFAGSEDRKNPIEGDFAIIKDKDYDSGTKFQIAKHFCDGQWFSGLKVPFFDLIVPIGGWESQDTFTNKWDDECTLIKMSFDEYRYENTKKKDDFKLVDLKTTMSATELEDMEKNQFQYFDDFMKPIKEFEDEQRKARASAKG